MSCLGRSREKVHKKRERLYTYTVVGDGFWNVAEANNGENGGESLFWTENGGKEKE